ncbi:AraC family transcriptional regulator [Microbacterium sp. SY138]|uniref:helix-turn-helix transcriptional regulator n=1 Tax=Microbacterium sp. SY138 TaxID=3149040 RepID=UPI00321A8B66
MAPVVRLIAVESTRTLPTNRVVFDDARIIHVMEGATEVETADTRFLLEAGASLAIGGGRWCSMRPRLRARMWDIYIDESFLRAQLALLLPDRTRVQRGFHPHEWNGGPLSLSPGVARLQRLEPLWQQMRLLPGRAHLPEVAAARNVELFARWMSIVAPTFLAGEVTDDPSPSTAQVQSAVRGRITDTATLGSVGRAVWLLRERMREPWTLTTLSDSVALSRAHLTRLFTLRTGISPIRFLTEVRLTEFTRLIEETELSISYAAQTVGWRDPRIASAWFVRRFGVTPSKYRLTPHPHHTTREARVRNTP